MTTEELSQWVHSYADRVHPDWQACSVTLWFAGRSRARTVPLNARQEFNRDYASEYTVKEAMAAWASAQDDGWVACTLSIRVAALGTLPSETLLVRPAVTSLSSWLRSSPPPLARTPARRTDAVPGRR